MQDSATTFRIEIDYGDDEFKSQIEDGATDPLGSITLIQAGDTAIVGGEDSALIEEYLTSFFAGTIQCLTDALRGERSYFTAGNGPVWVVFEPAGGDGIRYTHAYKKDSIDSPESRKPFEPSVVVSAETLVDEVVNTTREFLDHVAEWNPELRDSSVDYRGLREDIATLEREYRDRRE